MREYRKRKRAAQISARVSGVEKLGSQQVHPNTGFSQKGARRTFKTALELARTFPSGLLASRVCPYCYNTGYSSPGTQCSYCRSGEIRAAVRS